MMGWISHLFISNNCDILFGMEKYYSLHLIFYGSFNLSPDLVLNSYVLNSCLTFKWASIKIDLCAHDSYQNFPFNISVSFSILPSHFSQSNKPKSTPKILDRKWEKEENQAKFGLEFLVDFIEGVAEFGHYIRHFQILLQKLLEKVQITKFE